MGSNMPELSRCRLLNGHFFAPVNNGGFALYVYCKTLLTHSSQQSVGSVVSEFFDLVYHADTDAFQQLLNLSSQGEISNPLVEFLNWSHTNFTVPLYTPYRHDHKSLFLCFVCVREFAFLDLNLFTCLVICPC